MTGADPGTRTWKEASFPWPGVGVPEALLLCDLHVTGWEAGGRRAGGAILLRDKTCRLSEGKVGSGSAASLPGWAGGLQAVDAEPESHRGSGPLSRGPSPPQHHQLVCPVLQVRIRPALRGQRP